LRLEYPAYDIIVVDDGSDDQTALIVREYSERLTLLVNPRSKGPSAARNAAVRLSRSSMVAFTDGDCIVSKDWLDQLLKGLEQSNAVSCGGAQHLPADATGFERNVFVFLQRAGFITEYVKDVKASGIRYVEHNPSCSVMYRRDAFLESGGFLEGLWPGEDVDLDRRLTLKGYLHAFNPDAVVYHYRPKMMRGFVRMMYRYGWAQGRLVRQYGCFRLIHAVPVVALIVIAFLITASAIKPFIGLSATVAIALAALFYFSLDTFILAIAAFAYWNVGFVKGVLKTKQ
jgi:GT2 family glycosyltransferase